MTYQQSFPGVDEWEVMTSAMDIHQSIHQRWVKTLGKVMWLWTSEGTHMCGRGNDIKAHWCQQIVDPKMKTTTHQTGSQLARPNKGGVKWVSIPCVRRNDDAISLPDAEYSHPPGEGPSLPIEGWLHTLHSKQQKTRISQETRIDRWSMRTCSPKKRGGQLETPKVSPSLLGWTVLKYCCNTFIYDT